MNYICNKYIKSCNSITKNLSKKDLKIFNFLYEKHNF